MNRLDSFDFDLPPELIAQTPSEDRDGSRLLCLDRASGAVSHKAVRDLPGLLRSGDLLVFNDVRVRRARLLGRSPGGGTVELLLLSEVQSGCWECLGKPGKRLREGSQVDLPAGASARVVERRRSGRAVVTFGGVGDLDVFLERHGELPLPPYIKRPAGPSDRDLERYQTVFARHLGAVAAPTAGLHFTQDMLDRLGDAGVRTARVTLHVGPATFLPVRSETLDDVALEPERATIAAETVEAIAATRREGGRVIAVGTTTTRALESRAAGATGLAAGEFAADAFIRPGFEFRVIDGMMTNFHLPKSTLLVLVSAFAGRAPILAAYAEAVRQRYRFYSYGDATLIL